MGDIEKTLKKFGCAKFGHMLDYDSCELRLQFEWQGRPVDFRASWRGYANAWLRENPWSSRRASSKQEWERKALEKGQVAVYSILRDWLKGQLTAVETGLPTFDEVFMPYVLLPSGLRVIDHVKKQKLLPDGSGEAA